jgi:hypothetical protein
MYGVEFDTNRDGRGEFMIWGASPAGGAWTTDGVQVWKDSNHDVGGPTPVQSDAPWTSGDGYDQNLFNGGQGADPDLAWIRKGTAANTVELAFKYSAIGSSAQFFWNALADAGTRNPGWLDYNDHFTQDQAGSPLIELTDFYPLKQLFALDNTCRDYYGFTPAGDEPGLCLYYGSISGYVWFDQNSNGSKDGAETFLNGGTVTLKSGGCGGPVIKTTTTSGSGGYSFPGLKTPGNYCVTYVLGAWQSSTTTNPVSVVLAPNDNKKVNFGVFYLPPPA